MANFATAALVKAQAKLMGKFQAGELRFRDPAVHKLFLRNTTIMMPDYEALRTREDRVVETNYFLRTSRTLGTGRSHNHTGSQGDSGTLTPSWTTYNDTFVSTIKEADNKVYSMEELHMSKMENVIANFMEGLETTAINYAFNNRTGVNAATVEGTFDATDDVFQIASADANRATQITRMVMDINKYQGTNYSIVCDSVSFNKFMFDAAQGVSNATNTSFQFQNVEFIHAPELSALASGLVGTYTDGFWIAVPEGMIAALPWIPVQNRRGEDYGNIAAYGSILNPIDAVSYALHTYEDAVDGTGNGGYDQDVKIETEISLDIAYEHAPLSTATETPLFAFAIV